MSPSLKRAHEAHDLAARLLADDGISANARQNLSAAKMAAVVARGLYEAGRNGDAAEALAMAERMLNTATVQALLPDAERGAKVATGARDGHEAVHGTDEEKNARWRAMASEYRAAVEGGEPKMLARETVAARYNVHPKTVQRAAKKF